MGPGRSILRRVLIVGLLGIIAAGAVFLAHGRRIEPPNEIVPGRLAHS